MDGISDDWKKYPLLVIGTLPALPPGALTLAPAALGAPGTPRLEDFYVVVSLPPEAVQPLLLELTAAGARSEQILLFGAAADFAEGYGVLESHDDETAEEFRARLLQKLAGQRQQQLPAALRTAQRNGIAARLGEPNLAAVLDVTRLAHALACGYGLPPAAHGRVLRACLSGLAADGAPWTGEPSPENLIPATAAALYGALVDGKPAREALRTRIAGLSYRARTELLHHAECCLGALTGGKHAA